MADISGLDQSNVTKTVDNLGLETSINYANAEELRRETIKFTKTGSLPANKETIQKTPTREEALLGDIAQGRYATFPNPPKSATLIAAFTEGRLTRSIGDGKELEDKINTALKKTTSEDERTTVTNFSKDYKETDKNCSDIYGNLKQYNKG